MKYIVLTAIGCILFSVHSDGGQPVLKTCCESGFYIGAAVNEETITGTDSARTALVISQFNTITPENHLKWEKVHPLPGQYDFDIADQFVRFGEANGMFMVGHTLVWHAQTPRWVFEDENGNPADRETMIARLKDHISQVVGRYKGRIHGWDVVNEAIDSNGELRMSPWKKTIGDDYIELAFRFAEEADPDAELYYNDYGMDGAEKRAGVIRRVRALQDKGVKVSGVGMQGHYQIETPNLADVEASIIAYSELDVAVMFTELDLNVLPFPERNFSGADVSARFEYNKKLNPYTEGLPDSMQTVLSVRYADFFRLFRKHQDKISRVTFWGVDDGTSWLNNWPVPGRTNYPLLFDRNLAPKPALGAVLEVCGE